MTDAMYMEKIKDEIPIRSDRGNMVSGKEKESEKRIKELESLLEEKNQLLSTVENRVQEQNEFITRIQAKETRLVPEGVSAADELAAIQSLASCSQTERVFDPDTGKSRKRGRKSMSSGVSPELKKSRDESKDSETEQLEETLASGELKISQSPTQDIEPKEKEDSEPRSDAPVKTYSKVLTSPPVSISVTPKSALGSKLSPKSVLKPFQLSEGKNKPSLKALQKFAKK